MKTDQTVTFRIILPRDFCCHAAKLVIKKAEADEYGYINMQWDCMEGVGEEWWKVDFTAEKAALYKYHFEYDTSWGTSRIYHAGNGLAAIKGDGEDWQLTVYDKDFHTPEWLRGGIIYQIFPDRFASSGTKKQNVPSDRILRTDRDGDPYWIPTAEGKVLNNDYFGGDLNGIEQKLGYLKSLGVTCIYLNPIFEAQSNHRYDTADYEKIDSMLGTEKDFKSLCESAKKLGIRIMLDGVFSHTGDDSRYFNRYSRYDSLGAYQSKESPYYGWYKFNKWPDDYESWWGIEILPEVNEDNSDFIEYITGKNGIARKWLKLGASGWRLDVADELPDDVLALIREAAKAEKPDCAIIGEVWEDAVLKVSYGHRRNYALGYALDSVMNYPFRAAAISFARGESDAFALRDFLLSQQHNYPKPMYMALMNLLSSHDVERLHSALGASESLKALDRARQAAFSLTAEQSKRADRLQMLCAVIQYCTPGVPCLYYGDEECLDGAGDPFNRAPFEPSGNGLHNFYAKLGEIRNGSEALMSGEAEFSAAGPDVLIIRRSSESDCIVCVINRGSAEFKLRESGLVPLLGCSHNGLVPPCSAEIFKFT